MIESNRIEFKSELTENIEKEVIAFLNNDEGGEIISGINDDGVTVGLKDPDDLQKRLVDRIKNNINPSTLGLFDVKTNIDDNKIIINLIISSGPEKPYYLTSKGMTPKGCFVRVGTTAQPMTIEMIERLFSKRVLNSLKRIPSPDDELSFVQLRIFYEEAGYNLTNKFMKTFSFLGDDKKPNYAAYLMSDHNEISISIVKYRGKDKTDPVERYEMGHCSLIKAIQNILIRLETENKIRTEITPTTRIERRLVDPIALREAVVNAVVHNDYTNGNTPLFEIFSDRLVITSSGGLPQGLTQVEFFQGFSVPRNQELIRVFKDLGYVEQLGSGISRILSKYEANVFTFSSNFLRVSFPFEDDGETETDFEGENAGENAGERNNLDIKLSTTERQILEYMKVNPRITQIELSAKINKHIATIERGVKKLKEKSLISRVGSDTDGYWKLLK